MFRRRVGTTDAVDHNLWRVHSIREKAWNVNLFQTFHNLFLGFFILRSSPFLWIYSRFGFYVKVNRRNFAQLLAKMVIYNSSPFQFETVKLWEVLSINEIKCNLYVWYCLYWVSSTQTIHELRMSSTNSFQFAMDRAMNMQRLSN